MTNATEEKVNVLIRDVYKGASGPYHLKLQNPENLFTKKRF